ncbi:aldo/keto reductase [Frigoriglobus tundricola]|uniref:Oxidoreductase, aldo/keto reductase family n=1 Tax=Frigoriglobus tundricola TaxID=2774151 RepID=A0A6M5YWM3_9BACT|nr:aldo/keto reductase [Frigoriglobus tundricola]QJW98349.1 Oxidoreductase, aldo/keto reductase family [Frigoriglobus tundricola]
MGENNGPDRRDFLHASAAVPLAAGLAAAVAPPNEKAGTKVPLRAFGTAKDQVSALGLGGATLASAPSYEAAEKIVREALEAGVTFLDNAWEYADGRAEEWMGRAIKGRRDGLFLMTKVCSHGRDKATALKQLDESLKRLGTDHLDLWQIHEVVYWDDPDRHFAKGGAVEALEDAKQAGKVRYVGFTGHKHPSIHLKMLSFDFPFDAVQMPLNPFDATYRSFEREVLPVVNKKGMAAIGMKSFGGDGRPIIKGAVTAEEALRYAMSLPVAVTVSGIDSLTVLRQNLAVARGFVPMPAAEMDALRKRVAPEAADGHLELYKSSARYEGKAGREQHGFPPADELPL